MDKLELARQAGLNKYVPKVNDYVTNPVTHEQVQVALIDPTTLIPTFRNITPVPSGAFSDNDILLGVGPGTPSDTYRVYIDQSVMPHTLAVDARLFVGGSMVSTCKLFRGSELTGNQEVVSAFYDQSGTLLGQSIPLELVQMDGSSENLSIRTVPVCHTSFNLPDGEIVTAVFYSDTGHVVSKRQLLVENTAFIRTANAATKYVTGIRLESPFLSLSDPKLLQIPMNVPLNGLTLMGVVTYSDGTSLRMPVDGTKFNLFGFESFVATIPGQKFGLVLRYNVSPGEVAYSPGAGGAFMTETYKATVTAVEGAYSVKVFGYPVWVDSVNGYRMEWFMYNLDRQAVYRVTPWVTFNIGSQIFNPLGYGVQQRLSIVLNLKDVNGTFKDYRHVQTIDIALNGPGTTRTTNWTIAFDPGQNPAFGTNNFAATVFTNQNYSTVNVGCGAVTQAEWLERLYYNTKPLVDEAREVLPPMPNFFKLIVGSQELEFPISQWNTTQVLNTVLSNSGTLFIKFIKRTADNDIQLAVAGIPIYQAN